MWLAEREHVQPTDLEALVVLEAEGRVGRAMVAIAAQSRMPVVAVSVDLVALKLLKLDYPDADMAVLVGSVVDVRSAVWLANDLRKLGRRFSGVVAPVPARPADAGDAPTRIDALDVLRSRI